MRKAFFVSLLFAAFIACKSPRDDRPPLGASSGTGPILNQGCPPSKPQANTSCNSNGLDCPYGEPTFGCPDPIEMGELVCQTGLWAEVQRDAGACVAPGPGCPAPEIANGFTCPADASTGRCIYADCAGDASLVYTCVNGHLKGDGPVPSCDGGTDASDAGTD